MSTWKHVPHATAKIKGLPWTWCQRCGLVYLRNEPTSWCIAHGCDYDEHPDYKTAMKRLTKGGDRGATT